MLLNQPADELWRFNEPEFRPLTENVHAVKLCLGYPAGDAVCQAAAIARAYFRAPPLWKFLPPQLRMQYSRFLKPGPKYNVTLHARSEPTGEFYDDFAEFASNDGLLHHFRAIDEFVALVDIGNGRQRFVDLQSGHSADMQVEMRLVPSARLVLIRTSSSEFQAWHTNADEPVSFPGDMRCNVQLTRNHSSLLVKNGSDIIKMDCISGKLIASSIDEWESEARMLYPKHRLYIRKNAEHFKLMSERDIGVMNVFVDLCRNVQLLRPLEDRGPVLVEEIELMRIVGLLRSAKLPEAWQHIRAFVWGFEYDRVSLLDRVYKIIRGEEVPSLRVTVGDEVAELGYYP